MQAILALIALCLWGAPGCGLLGEPADTSGLSTVVPADRRFQKRVLTWQKLKSRHVVMQEHDYSCGAAALATLLQYYWGDDLPEGEILDVIFSELPEEDVADREENGLSMTDLRLAAVSLGYLASMRRMDLAALADLRLPVVVRIVKNDFKHFVVFRGMVGDRVFLADPKVGNHRISAVAFAQMWNGVVLAVVRPDGPLPTDSPLFVTKTPPVQNELQAVRRALTLRP